MGKKALSYFMSIEIYHLPPGNGLFRKTLIKRLLNTDKGPDYSGIFHLSPTAHIANIWRRAFSKEAEDCYIPPQSMTLKQLSRMICSTYSERNIISRALIPVIISGLEGTSPGHSNIIAEMIGELKRHYPSETPSSIKKTLNSTLSAFDIPDEVKNRTMNAINTFLRYDEALKSTGFMDEDDALILAAKLVREKRLQPNTLLLDGFYEITPAEEFLIRNLISVSEHTIATVPIDNNDDLSYCYTINLKYYFNINITTLDSSKAKKSLFYCPLPSMEDEISQIAKHIKSEFISGRFRDLDNTYLVFPSPSPYLEMTERVFKRYGVPVNISTFTLPSKSRPYRDLLSLLESIWEDYPRLKFSRFLTSPFFNNIPVTLKDFVPRAALNAGLIKGRSAWINSLREVGIHKELSGVFEALSPLYLCKYDATFTHFIKVLLDIIQVFRFTPSGDQESNLSELEAVFHGMSVLDEILPKKVDLAVFTDTLRRMLDEPLMQSEEPGVRVAGLFDVRGLDPGSLYMAGLKDGDLPLRPDIDFMLPDSVRKHLGLVDMKRHLRLQEHIFKRLVQSSGRTYLTYPTMEGDKFFLPSVFISDAEEKMEKIWGIFSKEEALLKQGNKRFETHPKEIKGIKRSFKTISVTDIDSYRSCPRRFYIEKVLGFEPPEILEYEMDALAIGTLTHKVMERLITKPFENIDIFTDNVAKTLDEVLPGVPHDEYLKDQFRESFMEISPDIYRLEESIKSEGFAFHKAEYKLEGEILRGITMRGKVDRIDLTPSGAAEIIDYKTGSPQFTSSRILKKGAMLQLFLYAAMFKKSGIQPERVGIYSLKDLKLKWLPGKSELNKGITMDEFIDVALGYLKETVSDMRRGDFRAQPLDDQFCRLCPESPYCPYIQAGSWDSEAGFGAEFDRQGLG